METYEITTEELKLTDLESIIKNNKKISLSTEVKSRIKKSRDYLDKKIKNSDEPIYGITTGFGALHNRNISKDDLSKLQKNLILSHACGVGDEVDNEIVKFMLLLKIITLSKGFSAIELSTINRLIDFFNNDILPVVYEQGSLGASGDLVPLAHMCLPLLGLGKVKYQGKEYNGKEILHKFNWQELVLSSKEGLALLNGTQFMAAFGVSIILKTKKLIYLSDFIASVSVDAFNARIEPFSHLIANLRKHNGQIETSKRIRTILEDSELQQQKKQHVQDPYSFRCIPQVHGASKDAINYVEQVIEREINAVTDNPIVFYKEDKIISGGNFHGQPLALSYDFLAIAISELANISERRTYRLIAGERGLPEFLVAEPGLNSGFMIPQYTAASIVSQNKQLSTPASVDSIASSNEQEDHVSMGANSATKLYKIAENVKKVISIEYFTASQSLDFRRPHKSSSIIEETHKKYRKEVPFLKEDTELSTLIKKTIQFVDNIEE